MPRNLSRWLCFLVLAGKGAGRLRGLASDNIRVEARPLPAIASSLTALAFPPTRHCFPPHFFYTARVLLEQGNGVAETPVFITD